MALKHFPANKVTVREADLSPQVMPEEYVKWGAYVEEGFLNSTCPLQKYLGRDGKTYSSDKR